MEFETRIEVSKCIFILSILMKISKFRTKKNPCIGDAKFKYPQKWSLFSERMLSYCVKSKVLICLL